jgi:hypothetical protein
MYMIAPVSICWHRISMTMLGRGSLDKYLLQGIIPADPRFISSQAPGCVKYGNRQPMIVFKVNLQIKPL